MSDVFLGREHWLNDFVFHVVERCTGHHPTTMYWLKRREEETGYDQCCTFYPAAEFNLGSHRGKEWLRYVLWSPLCHDDHDSVRSNEYKANCFEDLTGYEMVQVEGCGADEFKRAVPGSVNSVIEDIPKVIRARNGRSGFVLAAYLNESLNEKFGCFICGKRLNNWSEVWEWSRKCIGPHSEGGIWKFDVEFRVYCSEKCCVDDDLRLKMENEKWHEEQRMQTAKEWQLKQLRRLTNKTIKALKKGDPEVLKSLQTEFKQAVILH